MAEPRNLLAEAAALLEAPLRRAIAQRGHGRLAVAGGSAAGALGLLRVALAADWRRVRLTWVDERAVPFAHPDSNRGAAHRAGLLTDADSPEIELALYLDGERLEKAAARVTRALQDHFDGGLDALLLGMGEDGHVASLFPGHPALEATGLATSLVDSPKPPPARVTLTLGALGTAPTAVLLATGEAKRGALRRLRAGDLALPAARLPNLTVMTDLEDT